MVDCSDFYFFISLFPKISTMNMYYFYIQEKKALKKKAWLITKLWAAKKSRNDL